MQQVAIMHGTSLSGGNAHAPVMQQIWASDLMQVVTVSHPILQQMHLSSSASLLQQHSQWMQQQVLFSAQPMGEFSQSKPL
mmetsp:Transcript_66686/g.131476  ORF Transcript_66686/g.131476 Transcript_66686/m.131476 type:complete len:81 (-) Transcript_66686:139-381(-)